MVVAALVYNIWRVRNDVLWSSKLWTFDNTVKKIKSEIQMRIRIVFPKKASKVDREWVNFICKIQSTQNVIVYEFEQYKVPYSSKRNLIKALLLAHNWETLRRFLEKRRRMVNFRQLEDKFKSW